MDELALTIADDGVGLAGGSSGADALAGGSGNGLALHSTLLALVGGYLTVTAPPEGGTLVRIAVPKAENLCSIRPSIDSERAKTAE